MRPAQRGKAAPHCKPWHTLQTGWISALWLFKRMIQGGSKAAAAGTLRQTTPKMPEFWLKEQVSPWQAEAPSALADGGTEFGHPFIGILRFMRADMVDIKHGAGKNEISLAHPRGERFRDFTDFIIASLKCDRGVFHFRQFPERNVLRWRIELFDDHLDFYIRIAVHIGFIVHERHAAGRRRRLQAERRGFLHHDMP